MVEYMGRIVTLGNDLPCEERNLLSVAYKNVVGAKRTSWRVLSNEEEKQKDKPHEIRTKCINTYKAQIENEIKAFCVFVVKTIDDKLIQSASSSEAKVFYYKMKGDYYRYMAEISSGNGRKEAAQECLVAYQQATDSIVDFPPTHPTVLGLMLNFSVFYYEILDNRCKACQMAKGAFDTAISKLDTLNEDAYKDSTLIMQLLRDNLTLWTSEMTDNETEGAEGNESEQQIEQQVQN